MVANQKNVTKARKAEVRVEVGGWEGVPVALERNNVLLYSKRKQREL